MSIIVACSSREKSDDQEAGTGNRWRHRLAPPDKDWLQTIRREGTQGVGEIRRRIVDAPAEADQHQCTLSGCVPIAVEL